MISNKKTKYYLRPLGSVCRDNGIVLKRNGNALNVKGTFFTYIEVISRNINIKKRIYSISEFKKILLKNEELAKIYKNLNSKKSKLENSLLNKQNFSIFGILNITPDSFSDGGENLNFKNAIKNAEFMVKNGASFIDIGGESTRPGAKLIKAETEIFRVMPVIQKLNSKNINISLDTRNSSTMKLGILSGVKVINDVSALNHDKKSVEVINKYNTPVIIMHMPGNPETMMKKNKYVDVLLDVYDFLENKINDLLKKGINRENIIIDPGIGFGKDYKQNITLLRNISIFHSLGVPVMLGVSRKRFIDSISKESNPSHRLGGTISATLLAKSQGVRIHRVHDVKEINQALLVFEKLFK